MSDQQDKQDYQDYQDYLAYQQHLASAKAQTTPGGSYASPIGPNPTLAEAPLAYAKKISGVGKDDGQITDNGAPKPVAGTPPLAIPGGQAGPVLNGLAKLFSSSLPGRLAGGATQGALSDPEHPGRGALTGAGMAAGGEALAGLTGKAGDYAMQKAVGRSRYTPGVGTELADQGLWGTKGMMKRQVANGLADTGEDIGKLAAQIPDGAIDSSKISKNVASTVDNLRGGGSPSVVDAEKVAKIDEMANDIASRGAESGSQALQRRIAAGTRAYNGKENPLLSLIGQASKQEQAGYSQAMKEAYAAANPESPQALADADRAYAALAKANKGLTTEQSLPQSLAGYLFRGGGAGALGYLAGGAPGAAVGALAATPAGMSTLGQALTKTSQTANTPLLREAILKGTQR